MSHSENAGELTELLVGCSFTLAEQPKSQHSFRLKPQHQSRQDLLKLSDSFDEWHQPNGGNFTDLPDNSTLILPKEESNIGGHTIWQVIVIVFICGSLSLVTVIGNILVLVSFKINKALKTVNNYYLLSLASADLIIGTLSMNLYTVYIIMGQWNLGPVICDLWLTIDYVASNASVMNLLVISFDRYFSVTKPLSFRAKRTTKRAMIMIGLAWSISFILWAPAILFWQFIVGERTVLPNECYIQFLSEPIITFCTAIAAFYLPVTIMAVLFWKIYQETQKRAKDVQGLKGSGSSNSPNQAENQGRGSGRGGVERGLGCSGTCCPFLPDCLSLLPGHHSSRTSVIAITTTEGEAERSRCVVFMNKQACVTGNQSEEGADGKDQRSSSSNGQKDTQSNPSVSSLAARQSTASLSIKNTAMAKRFASKAKTEINRRKNEKKANEKKAAQTLSAILLAFIATWLPYNIMVLVNIFCENCIPENLWALGYWLCYVNSTVNPMCYAMCNKAFRTTFREVLMCQCQRQNKPPFHYRRGMALRKERPTVN
ncbi:muscarinic acetylcholine receptor M1 [Genypterus blacodes]|uniref:muscarinic acetylcholine receptor M1 n=1 Tax=Genypterus blacodes TaxID=154954 RepID=UPI003F76B93D